MDELATLIARMIHHYRDGGAGYTWLDAAIDMVGEHGYVILSQNGDGKGPAVILINDETLGSTRQLIERLRQIGQEVDDAGLRLLAGCADGEPGTAPLKRGGGQEGARQPVAH